MTRQNREESVSTQKDIPREGNTKALKHTCGIQETGRDRIKGVRKNIFLFGKTAIDYVKLYEGMGISENIFEEFHVAHDYGEVPLP